jgi:predicted transcriptional regulator
MRAEAVTIENRRRIYEHIRENPCTHLRRLSRDLDVELGALRHHLDYLEATGVVASRREQNLRIYFATEVGADSRRICTLLQQKRFRDLILAIILRPGSNHGDLAEALGLRPSTLSKYLGILEDRGVVEHVKEGRERHYHVKDEQMVMKLLITYRRSFWDSFVDNVLEVYFD